MDNIPGTVNLDRALSAGLYLVATPIGNLRDITLRALDVLNGVDIIMCEDTRVTAKLLNAHSIKKPLQVYNDHSDDGKRAGLIAILQQGQKVALVSDAGTPLISDPGYKLVREALSLGLSVTALPGANAPLTALQMSGLPSDAFSFIGFLPPKNEARKKKLAEWARIPGTLIVFESGPRLEASLEAMHDVLGDRQAAVVREMTKLYEESRRGTLNELRDHYREHGHPKGEIVIVIGQNESAGMGEQDIDILLEDALVEMTLRDAVAHVVELSGRPRKEIYGRALAMAARRV